MSKTVLSEDRSGGVTSERSDYLLQKLAKAEDLIDLFPHGSYIG
jgi:hypothetical protein